MPRITTSVLAVVEGCSTIPVGGRRTFYFYSFVTNSNIRDINHGFKDKGIKAVIEIDGNIIRVKII